MSINASDVVLNAETFYANRANYAYFYGTMNDLLTSTLMDNKINAYPAHFSRYTQTEIVQIKQWSIDKIGYDCSGLVCACIGLNYHITSYALIQQCAEISMSNLVDGCLLWKTGHIGIYVGNGYFIHTPLEMHSVEKVRVSDYNWTKAGLHPNVIYPSPPPPVPTGTKRFWNFWFKYLMGR